jgi:hypothetical protein
VHATGHLVWCVWSASGVLGHHLTDEVVSVTVEIAWARLNVEATWRDHSDRTLVGCVRSF